MKWAIFYRNSNLKKITIGENNLRNRFSFFLENVDFSHKKEKEKKTVIVCKILIGNIKFETTCNHLLYLNNC